MLGRGSIAGAATGVIAPAALSPFAPSQAKVPLESWLLSGEQQTAATVCYWDTPFTPLEGDVASAGLKLEVREPLPTANWRQYLAAFRAAATPAALQAAFQDTTASYATVGDGRVANVLEYWGGGAPAWYGVTQRQRMGLHWTGVFRGVSGRSWFSANAAETLTLALAGNGYVRVVRTSGAVATEVLLNGSAGVQLSETDYLTDGYVVSEPITLAAGDTLDIYYVQNGELWGGLVVKAALGSAPTEAELRDAPVLGCGLFDSGVQPTKQTLGAWAEIEVNHELNGAATATINLPLINPKAHDGFGYEWRRGSDGDDPGVLVYWDGGVEQFTMRRGALIQVDGGLVDEQYRLFTGFIDDFESPSDGRTVIRCVGFEYRALKASVKNEPDEISYMTWGYRKQRGTTEPVFGVPAYDNWQLEHAVQDVLVRAGIDSSRFAAPLLATRADGSSVPVSYNGEQYRKFRARTLTGTKLRLERSVRYGNVGNAFDDGKPVDDPYVFKPDASREPWARVREFADRYGYDVRFDQAGDCVLATRGNASAVVDIQAVHVTGGQQRVHPSAHRGTYWEWAPGELAQATVTIEGSRVDVSLPRGPGLGAWDMVRVVRVSDEFEVARITNLQADAPSEAFFYDYRTTTDGTNATLFTVFSGPHDTYRVECQGTSDPDLFTRRLDAWFVFAIDPLKPLYPRPLTTEENALQVVQRSSGDQMLNLAYIVGRRKATVQDSEKLRANPNNPEPEFIVEVAVDTESITDPNAKNFVGGRRESVVYDDSIIDPDYAAYLARTLIYRYRMPRPPADIVHTILPVLELRDPLFAEEATYQTVDSKCVLWATRFTHRFEASGKATTTIGTSAWPEFPSFELRDDIDIDDPTTFNGVPITNVEVRYTGLNNTLERNLPSSGVVAESTDADIVEVEVPVVAGSPPYLDFSGQPWPPVPGTLQLRPGTLQTVDRTKTFSFRPLSTPPQGVELFSTMDTDTAFVIDKAVDITSVTVVQYRALTSSLFTGPYAVDREVTANRDMTGDWQYEWNKPARELTVRYIKPDHLPHHILRFAVRVAYKEALDDGAGEWLADTPYHHFTNVDFRDAERKVYLPWVQGDSTTAYQRNAAQLSYVARYRKLGPVDGTGAFADPYAARGGSPFWDLSTSELGYLAEFQCDTLVTGFYRLSVRSVFDDTVVAWLTEPTADVNDPEAHWAYVTAGPDRAWSWDGTDQLGVWNRRQSEVLAAQQQGLFELNEKQPVGAGWLVWNQERDHGQLGPLGLIAADRDAMGAPEFGQGTYAAWYIHVEVQNDHLEEVAEADPTKPCPRIVSTVEPGEGVTAPVYTTASTAGVIYTHQPGPVQAELTVQDWVAGFAYDPAVSAHQLTDANWGAADADATLRNDKPVRIQLTARPRPGVLWAGRSGEQQLKVYRHVHLRALVNDQFVVFGGISYPGTQVEQRTVYSRQLVNDDHTLLFEDKGWRQARTLRNADNLSGTVQWVFRPADFKKRFAELEESLEFGDYLQLMEVPKWDPSRSVAGERSRFVIGFMAYLFYLSVYVQGRDGQRSWCTNRRFLDKSKLCANAYGDWWAPGTATAATSATYRAPWPVDPSRLQRRTVVCRQWTGESDWEAVQRDRWGFSAGDIGDKLLRHRWEDHEPTATTLNGAVWPTLELDEHTKWHLDGRSDLPAGYSAMFNRQLGTWTGASVQTELGLWTWEQAPLWIPSVSRDFHPHFLIPPMVDPIKRYGSADTDANIYGVVFYDKKYDPASNAGADAAGAGTWSSWARDMTAAYTAANWGTKRFRPGTHVDVKVDPNKPPLAATAIDYVRQLELVHWEDLRGCFTRGPRPAEGPRKITPVAPYHLNAFRYDKLHWRRASPTSGGTGVVAVPGELLATGAPEPRFYAGVTQWFRLSFRSEYIVESPQWFPTGRYGDEFLGGFLPERTRYLAPGELAQLRYDAGAWVGWKDDAPGGTLVHGVRLPESKGLPDTAEGAAITNVFNEPTMPVAVGPELAESTDVFMHLVLVPERRDSSV